MILTRAEGRTPVPEGQELADLARHRATLVLFLSVKLLGKVVGDLTPSYGEDCPVAVVYRASWPDQKIILGTLADIRDKVRDAGISSQSIVIVGRVLTATDFADSRLYAADFSHGFRKALATGETPSDQEPGGVKPTL